MAHPQTTPADVHAMLAAAPIKIVRRRVIEPCLIDPCMRENPVGARIGLAAISTLVWSSR